MSSERPVILVEDVYKRYRLGVTDRSMIADELSTFWSKLRGKGDPTMRADAGDEQRVGEHFWSLRGVNFTVQRGDILGLIGHNGAGKSTLLKLLSRITPPTQGHIRMRGRVSSLLEVGTGFHPELTGRENIYLNGAIMGMRRAEIDAKLDGIIAFSGIEHHIDSPIKRYSVGMKIRLGFAVAAHLEPDIMIVDEVLAVGDAEFQRKCLGSMRDVANAGRTVIFVSHSMPSVQSLCTRAIWLHKGRIRMDGDTEPVIRDYLVESAAQTHERQWDAGDAPGTDEVRLSAVRITSKSADGAFRTGEAITVEMDLINTGVLDTDLNIQLIVRTESDSIAFISDMTEAIGIGLWPTGANRVSCTIPPDLMNDGAYRFSLLFQRKGNRHFLVQDVLSIEIQEGPRRGAWFQKWQGAVRPKLEWVR
jgi:lipopolysaccharide transport system ATP-binding protein